jgi:DNA-binding Lrp family transcriptional regulator
VILTDRTSGPSELDELDFRIIGQLQDDGRKPTTEIARALCVPRTTVARRIERLVNEHVITIGVFARGPKIGLPVHAMIMLEVAPGHYESVVEAIAGLAGQVWSARLLNGQLEAGRPVRVLGRKGLVLDVEPIDAVAPAERKGANS